MQNLGIAVLLALASTLVACSSHLETREFVPGGATPTGVPYRLTFNQYDITVKWQATECNRQTNELAIKISASLKQKTAHDPEVYYIDPRSLTGWFKTGESTFEWHPNRATKSVNASADDKLGQSIVNIATGIGKIIPATIAGGSPRGQTCTSLMAQNINDVDSAQDKVLRASDNVAAMTLELTRQNSRITSMGSNVDRASSKAKSKAVRQLEVTTLNLEQEKLALEQALKKVSFQQTQTWPATPDELKSTTALKLPTLFVKKWGLSSGKSSDTLKTINDLDVYFQLSTIHNMTYPSSAPVKIDSERVASKSVDVRGWKGLPYREPVDGVLTVCAKKACSQSGSIAVDSIEVQSLQLGPMLVMPFEGRPFASNKASAVFAEDGTLSSAGYSQIRSTAEGVTETFKNSSEQLAPVITAEREEELKTLTLKANTAKAKKELEDARANPTADEALLKSLESELALAEAETKLINAKKALIAAKNGGAQ
ncbi:hypothetical protein [Pseudomonas sp. DR 5-09]|uniref:hypothetical protein n=1 Tax=Pseudomonas sp. DR 5-09 TaxID=1534110 RepID=UPI0007DCE602|nr:hypothetical protein [Pseudomonas sp. DR 5-09]ANI55326.1 hypothetical protein PDR5_35960 [Pseudomonas sp. DR 5-09]